MQDLDDDRVMTTFLLGALGAGDIDRIADRLVGDAPYFEAMAALEDDLILRWTRGDLPAEQVQRFVRAYLHRPARRARVDASRILIEAVRTWIARLPDSSKTRPAAWRAAPPHRGAAS